MAGSVNKVILVGNLGRDPEVRSMQDGRPVINMSVATSENWRDRQTGERKERTEWHRVVIFNEKLAEWLPALDAIAADPTIDEVILSGGDPLTVVDDVLEPLVRRLEAIPHLRTLRIHTRLPIFIPERVCDSLLAWFSAAGSRLTPICVVHANHAAELDDDVAAACDRLRRAGVVLLNQAVLLRGVNDSVAALDELSRRLVALGVMPYYLHQLDRVAGAAHFEVPEAAGLRLVAALRERLPGYAVPRYVREQSGAPYKVPLID